MQCRIVLALLVAAAGSAGCGPDGADSPTLGVAQEAVIQSGTWRPQSQVQINGNWHFGPTWNGKLVSAQTILIAYQKGNYRHVQTGVLVSNRTSQGIPSHAYATDHNSFDYEYYDYECNSSIIAPHTYSVCFGPDKTYDMREGNVTVWGTGWMEASLGSVRDVKSLDSVAYP